MSSLFASLDYSHDRQIYEDFIKGLSFLNNFWKTYSQPSASKEIIFHTYTEFRDFKQEYVALSFLATQPSNHKLIVWSDYDISDHKIFKFGSNRVTNIVWNPLKESQKTPLQNFPELVSLRDDRYWINSDLLRLLVLFKYGGVWVDMDTIFLNTFEPLTSLEFMYVWGSDFNFFDQGACGSVMSLQKESQLAYIFLETLIKTPPRLGTTCWGRDLFANVYKAKKFSILPSSFFNTEWNITYKYGKGYSSYVQLGMFRQKSDNIHYIFPEAFSWHWHNSSKKNFVPESGSKFSILSDSIDRSLKRMGYS